ncbi:MAG: hypothetical protein P8L85_19210 [Rubripirellula sp.]|nr:hypothetical protein [Rubripirellula sp.]
MRADSQQKQGEIVTADPVVTIPNGMCRLLRAKAVDQALQALETIADQIERNDLASRFQDRSTFLM